MGAAWFWLGLIVVLVAAGVGLWLFRRWRASRRPLISLVLMLREPRQLDEQALAEAATRALGVEVTADDEEATANFAAGESPHFMLKVGGCMFLVNNLDRPYVEDVAAAAERFGELRAREAFVQHRAWLSVDLLQQYQEVNLRQVYQLIGKVIAELVDDDCLLICAPQLDAINLIDDELLEKLRGPEPLSAFDKLTFEPVFQMDGDAPAMKAAVAEARRRWPEFAAAFERRQPGHEFLVKAPFADGQETEFMWLLVSAIEGDVIHGTLENEPVNLKGISQGDQVRVQLADLNDWAYFDGSEAHGMFTQKVIAEAHGR